MIEYNPTAPLPPAVDTAIRRYPSLRGLLELRESGAWVFQPTLDLLVGWRQWDRVAYPPGWVDSIAIRSEGDAQAIRCDGFGDKYFEESGSLMYVLGHLIDLPAPNHPKAPKLIRGVANVRVPPYVRRHLVLPR